MRLGKYSSVLLAPGVIATTFLAGCIIVGTGSNGSDNSGGVGGGTSSGSGGGEPKSSSSVGTTTPSTSSGTMCVEVDGPGLVSDCDKMNIAPMNGASSNCGPKLNEPPLGYGVCKHAFAIYTSGPATDLKNCLSGIGVQDRCDDKRVETCVESVYDSTCRNDPQFAKSCASINDECATKKLGSIDQPQCIADLTILNQPSSDKFIDCLEAEFLKTGTTCNGAYNTCYDQLLQF